jgi:uncharacterized membrane protein YraQ (UPF0718 family)
MKPSFLKKLSGKLTYTKIISSQFFGMISPLSILSFLPIANELTSKGVNPSLLLSFFVAERAYDLQSFFIISSLFGIKFAIFNAIAIFLSLLISAIALKQDVVKFAYRDKSKNPSFWTRQLKLLVVVLFGIGFGTLIRILLPENLVTNFAKGYINSIASAIIIGFSLYLGPIVGNYPVAKAFLDLGMSHVGVFAFLTISPIFNFVVILLFGGAVGFTKTIKAVVIYTLSALLLTLLFSTLI